jgi:hypothetical protein
LWGWLAVGVSRITRERLEKVEMRGEMGRKWRRLEGVLVVFVESWRMRMG